MKINSMHTEHHTSETGLLLAVISLMSIMFDHLVANLGDIALSIGILSGSVSIFINVPKIVTTINYLIKKAKSAFNRFK